MTSIKKSQRIFLVAGKGTKSTQGTSKDSSHPQMSFNEIGSLWKDSADIIYVAEKLYSNCVRKFQYPSGVVSIVAGLCDVNKPSSREKIVDGPATSTLLSVMSAVVDSKGAVYISSPYHQQVSVVVEGRLSKFIGSSAVDLYEGDFGPCSSARIEDPLGMWIDSVDRLYVIAGRVIRKVDGNGIISYIVGSSEISYKTHCESLYSKAEYKYYQTSAATCAQLSVPQFITVDTVGHVYFTDRRIVRQVDENGVIRLFAGMSKELNYESSEDNLPATSTNLFFPKGIAVHPLTGDIYVASKVGKIYSLHKSNDTFTASTFAGYFSQPVGRPGRKRFEGLDCSKCFAGDGGAATSALLNPNALFLDDKQQLFVSSEYRIAVIRREVVTSFQVVEPLRVNAAMQDSNLTSINLSVLMMCFVFVYIVAMFIAMRKRLRK